MGLIQMDVMQKLEILADAAKYDVACTSSGSTRGAKNGTIGTAVAGGICHSFTPDGRCISLLKILLTNECRYDCAYCGNRRTANVPRAMFTPQEVAELTIRFYKRNYIEGLFLSSAVHKNADYTMELLISAIRHVREYYHFNGYIHVKSIPGAHPDLIKEAGLIADRISTNIELPSSKSLTEFAPEKTKEDIISSMKTVRDGIITAKNEIIVFKNTPKFTPAGQSTQLIVGATPESDAKIVTLSEGLYNKFKLKRVFYSAYIPTNPALPKQAPPLRREHRLYQADWLLRFYGYKAGELFMTPDENLRLDMDPKCQWALNNLEFFPVEIMKADYGVLLRIPGIGQVSAEKIIKARRVGSLSFDNLKKMKVVLKRAKYFITINGKMMERSAIEPEFIAPRISDSSYKGNYNQLTLDDIGSIA